MQDLSVSDSAAKKSADDLEVIFKEMVQMCLWCVVFGDVEGLRLTS